MTNGQSETWARMPRLWLEWPARLFGRLAPLPAAVSTVTDPPRFSTFSSTMARPSPLPDTCDTTRLVERPEAKARRRASASSVASSWTLRAQTLAHGDLTQPLYVDPGAVVRDADLYLVVLEP